MKRVLVIDDEDVILQLIEELLQDAGYEVMTATNGEEGLTCIQIARPDLIITDLMMPRLDGLGLCERIQTKPEWRIIPIILLSVVSHQMAKSGCNWAAVIRKPFDVTQLITTVTNLIDKV
jgi:two-component system alkaline phosphatase synthesis response regulator PhoP